MNDKEKPQNQDRSAAKGRFLTRFYRYRKLLVSKWWVLLAACLVGVIGAFVFSRLQQPTYSSFGRMIVSPKLSIPEGSAYTEEMSNFLGTQSALMKSGVVINRAHARVLSQKPNLQMDTAKLRVTILPRTTIFILQASGSSPDYVQLFVQGCMDEYINLKREMRSQTSDTTVAGLTDEVLRLEKELGKAEDELVRFQSSNSVVLLQEQGNNAGSYMALLTQRLAVMKSEYELLQSLTLEQNLERTQQSGGNTSGTGGGADDVLTRTMRGGPDAVETDYLRAKQQLLLLKAAQEELGRYLRPKHPKMVAMSEEIAQRERLLEIFREQSTEQLESRKKSIGLQIQNLEREYKELDAKTLENSQRMAEFQRLKNNAQRTQTLYEKLLATLQTVDVNKEIAPESVAIMENASKPLPDQAKLHIQLLIGALAGLAVGILGLLLVDRLDDRITAFSELQETFEEEVLSQIPHEKATGRGKSVDLIMPDDKRYSFVEAYRNLRSSLLFMPKPGEKQPKVILLTSSIPNEGKSLTCANLSIMLASSGARVLLVDADLRKGTLHHRLDAPAEPGLTEVLSQGLRWEEVTQTTKYANVFILPRGASTGQSSEFFINAATGKFLKEAAAKFDFVVIDTPPVMAADDVTSLAPHVDALLFVVRAEFTSARVAKAALDVLYQRQAPVLGLVFNGVRRSSVDYYYYYKYKDYYAPYKHSDQVDTRHRHHHHKSRESTPVAGDGEAVLEEQDIHRRPKV